jgi:peptide/nickel transport system permease protein
MAQFIVRRLIQAFFLVLAVTAMVFFVQRIAPGGPAQFNEDPRQSPDYAAQVRRDLGLDKPIPVQYAKWLWQLSHLNFGRSFTDKRPVMDKIMERVPATMLLSGTALLIGFLGIPLGVFAALKRGSPFDHFLRLFTVLGNAVPNWWLGLMILLISVKTVNWFPIAGTYTPGNGSILDRLHHLLLPAIVLGTDGWLGYSRLMRSEFLEVISQDYVRTARAKGLGERVVLIRHTLRNALIVMVTVLGGLFATLLSGSVLVENVFSWPGMGRLAFEAATQRDYPLLMGLVVIGSVLVIIGYLISDILYAYVDPRIRLR